MLLASDCVYSEWANNRSDLAYMRRKDFLSAAKIVGVDLQYAVHPQPGWDLPHDKRPGNQWIYQNT